MFLGFAAVFNAVRVSCIVVGPQVFAQLLGRCATRNAETCKHGSEQGGPQTRTMKHTGCVRNHPRTRQFAFLVLAVLGGQSENGHDVVLSIIGHRG